MRALGIVLAGVLLVLPGLATGQANPLPAPSDGKAAPPPLVLVQGPGGFPPPMPGRPHAEGLGRPGPAGPPPGRGMGPGPGTWWKDSEAVKKLGVSETQVGQIEQAFLAHRLRLVDLRADLEKQELNLQPLLDADRPDETKVAAQIDLITAARGRLEKEHASMLLAIRRVLSTEQWKQLQALQHERVKGGPGGPPMPVPGRPSPPSPPR